MTKNATQDKNLTRVELPIPNTLLTLRDFIWRERSEYQNACPFVKIFSDRNQTN